MKMFVTRTHNAAKNEPYTTGCVG